MPTGAAGSRSSTRGPGPFAPSRSWGSTRCSGRSTAAVTTGFLAAALLARTILLALVTTELDLPDLVRVGAAVARWCPRWLDPAKIGGMPDAGRLVRSPALSSVAEYAYAALVSSGSRLVFTAGACPLDENGTTVGVGDVRAQASQVVANLEVSLRDAGASLDDIVRTTIYVASHDQRDLGAAWAVIRDALAPHDPPSTLLGVAVLGYTDQLVEMDAVAALAP